MEIKVGDWLLIKKDAANVTGYYPTLARDNQYPILVNRLPTGDGTKGALMCIIKEISSLNFNLISLVVYDHQVSVISEEEAKKSLKLINKNFYINLKEKLKLIKTKHESIDKRSGDYYVTRSKSYLKTSTSSVKIVPRDSITSETTEQVKNNIENKVFNVECCSFTKITSDLLVYIPKTWLNYYGYNLTDLKSYLSFLKKCDIGFSAEILSIVDLHNSFKAGKMERPLTQGSFYLKKDELAYEILIKGSDFPYVTYLYFLLVRYIFNRSYWNIPFISMKLKKNLPKATNWQCLLLAHNNDEYNSYYSFADVNENNCLYHKYEDLANNPKSVLDALKGKSSVNRSFTLRPMYRKDKSLRQLIRNENYELLEQFLNEK